MTNRYLEKHAVYGPLIDAPADERLYLTVVIPCYNESGLLRTLDSLKGCSLTDLQVEVIVVINASLDDVDAIQQNEKTKTEFEAWKENNKSDKISFHTIVKNDLEKKHAGVGLARKIGMDEAVRRFDSINNPDGVIICLDADCTVSENYLSEIEKHFLNEKKTSGCSIYYEHPLAGSEFGQEVYDAVSDYELYLRYYHTGLKWSGYPYPFQTVGSCMAVGYICR